MALRRLNKIAAAVAATMVMGAAQADSISFSRLYTLGDSLTDGGAYSGAVIFGGAPAGLYRFTNNALDGSSRVYAEVLANRLGLPLPVRFVTVTGPNDPNQGANGANYAQGGSRVALQPGTGASPGNPFVTTLPVTQQVDQLLADRPTLSDKDLVVLWAGANDGFVQFGAASTGSITPTEALTNMAVAAGGLAAQVDRIKAAGGRNVVVILVPDLAQTPLGALVTAASASGGVLLSSLAGTFNQTLRTAADQRNAFVFDSNKVLSAVIADPARFGFNTNTLGAVACGQNPAATGPNDAYNSSLTNCFNDNPQHYLFADEMHPSAKAHNIFGEILMGSLRAISQASNLATGPMIAARQHSMELENRLQLNAMQNADGKARPVGKVHVYGGAEAGGFKDSAGQIDPAVDMKTQRYRIGIDQQFSTSMMGGVLFSYGNGKTDFGAGTGQVKTDEVTATAYISKVLSQNTYINASIGMGTIDHDFQRNIILDTTTLSASSKPKGRYESYRVGGGGVYDLGGWKLGPNASLAHEKVTIERFDEAAGAASMSFGEMDYTVQRFSLGLNIDQTASVGQWRGFGRLVHDWDLKSGDLQVRIGHAAGTLASFDIERPKTMWQATVGIMRPASDGSTLSLSVGMGGRDGGGDTRIIGVNYRIEL